MDYVIHQAGTSWKVEGDWPGEVMGQAQDGTHKENCLYKPGDVFIVNANGWLVKTDEVNTLLMKYENSNKKG